jgi:catechol 2,3-dioxygenase-like lactoylglutathione lyase family enzyme
MKYMMSAAVALLLASSASGQEQKRPQILGIARVTIDATTATDDNPFKFYGALHQASVSGFSTGGASLSVLAIDEHQELSIVAANFRVIPKPGDSPRKRLVEVLFETSDVAAIHDYLDKQGINVTAITADDGQLKGPDGKVYTGDGSLFTLDDPDGHRIGFIEFKTPLTVLGREGRVGTHLLHAGFVVRDRAATEHFYKDILGFRPYWHGGMKDGKDDWVALQVPDGTDWVEFMLNISPDADKHTLGVMNHIALGVPDIHAAQKQLLTNGMKLTEEPKIGRDGKWQLNVYDPDDTRVEFMEFTPVEKPCCSEFTGPHPKP